MQWKKWVAAILTVCVLTGMLPATVLAAYDEKYDISVGSITISTDGTYLITGNGETTANTIRVNAGVDAEITLRDVRIESDDAAMDVTGANVVLILEGDNSLTSGGENAGLQKNDTAGKLTIRGAGSLSAVCSTDAPNYFTAGGAGIGGGGDAGRTVGNIFIEGGRITAKGGTGHNGGGAGIGAGGNSGSATDIYISGGVITAIGGTNGAAGIGGGGHDGTLSNISITGGWIIAQGQFKFGTPGDGQAIAIGGGAAGSSTDLSSSDHAVIFDGTTKTGTVYGTYTAAEAVEIPDGYVLSVPVDGSLLVGSSGSIANSGAIYNYGGTVDPSVAGDVRQAFTMSVTPANPVSFGDTITLSAQDGMLPSEGSTASLFLGSSLLAETTTSGTVTSWTIQIPEEGEASEVWTAGLNLLHAEASCAGQRWYGEFSLEVLYRLELPAPQASRTDSTGIQVQPLSLPAAHSGAAVEYGLAEVNDAASVMNWSTSLTISGLEPDTTYYLFARVSNEKNSAYQTVYSPGTELKTAPIDTQLPEDGLNIGDGGIRIEPVSEQPGTNRVTQNQAVYLLPQDTPVLITGSSDFNRLEITGATARVVLQNAAPGSVSISGSSHVTVTLEGSNTLSSRYGSFSVRDASSLTFEGSGTLSLDDSLESCFSCDTQSTLSINSGSLLIKNCWMHFDSFSSLTVHGGTLYHVSQYDWGSNKFADNVTIDGGSVYFSNPDSLSVTGRYPVRITAEASQFVQALYLQSEDTQYSYGTPGIVPEDGVLTLWLPEGTYSGKILIGGSLYAIPKFTVEDDGSSDPVSLTATGTQVILPSDLENTPTFTGDGTQLQLPEGSAVPVGGSLVTVGAGGGTIDTDGTPGIALPAGGSVSISSAGGSVSVTVPEAAVITPTDDDSISVPAGSTVQAGDGPAFTLPGGGTVQGDTVSAPAVQAGGTAVTAPAGSSITISAPNGDAVLPVGSTIGENTSGLTIQDGQASMDGEGNLVFSGSGQIAAGPSGEVIVTIPAREDFGLEENGDLRLPGGSQVSTGAGASVTVPQTGGTLNPATGAVTLYYAVSFDSQGGSSVEDAVIAQGSRLPAPADPIRDGYTFTGWYQDSACTDPWEFDTMYVTDDLILYAGWALNSNTGSSSSSGSSSVSGSGSNVSISAGAGSVTASQMTQAANRADQGAVITIHATAFSSISLPAAGLSAAAGNENDIRLNLRFGSITLSAEALAGLTEDVSANDRIDVSVARMTDGTTDELSALLAQDAAVFQVTVAINGVEIHNFDGALTVTFTVPNLTRIDDPHVLHILSNGSREYYAPSQVAGNQITIDGIRSLSVMAVIPGSLVPQATGDPFTDVSDGDYFHDAVLWAVEEGITAGISETIFGSDLACTRGQMVTFLWRAAGSPIPNAAGSPFQDVTESDYFYNAVLWAVENGITAGSSETAFAPDDTVTRGQAVTFLWRAAGSPAASGSSFTDVPADAWYAQAVAWAAAQGITSGTGDDTFSPEAPCTRAQIVTFLFQERT